MDEYWKPSEINYGDRYQILWLLEHLKELQDGYYPKDPRETGYTDAPSKGQINKEAPFIKGAEIYAELTARLNYCGKDGELVYWAYAEGVNIDELSRDYKLDFYEVIKRINRCLSYITSGHDRRWHDNKRRKGITYEDWGKRQYMLKGEGKMEEIRRCTNCGKPFSTKLGLVSLCGDCEDALIIAEVESDIELEVK